MLDNGSKLGKEQDKDATYRQQSSIGTQKRGVLMTGGHWGVDQGGYIRGFLTKEVIWGFLTAGVNWEFFSAGEFCSNWPPHFGDLVSYLGEFLLFFDYRNCHV